MIEVVLISACQKKAIPRTRAVLDRYAFRMGESTWTTPITQEGLQSLQISLRATASRNTAVLCLRRDRKLGLVPLWVVGNRARFGEDWRTPVFVTETETRSRTVDRESDYPWLSVVKRIAAISGLFHDLGKNNRFFAEKILKDTPMADPIRHEWLSTQLVLALADSGSPDLSANWGVAVQKAEKTKLDSRIVQCNDAFSVVLFCVATHHRMLNEENDNRVMDAKNMINDRESRIIPRSFINEMAASYPESIRNKVAKAIQKLSAMNGGNHLYWSAIAFLSRVALILADHQVSSLRCTDCKEAPFANSYRDKNGKRHVNQTLQWHLQSVEKEAAAMADRIFRLEEDLDGLSAESLSGIQQPASGRFQWQEDAVQSVQKARMEAAQKPFLLAVISGTGSGKTRACARLAAACAIRDKVRFTAIFNLRTLTLQTGTAYRKQLGIQEPDMAVVIGDAMIRRAHAIQNEDDMDRSLGEEIEIVGMGNPIPEWLTHFVKNDSNLRDLIASPVFVSTADYLVPAGDLTAQGRHIMPLLRLLTADLILDEIDNYDSHSVAAILRLVYLSGLFGRSVIASSATMTPALADSLVKHYEHGASMRAALYGKDVADFGFGVISDQVPPTMALHASAASAMSAFQNHLDALQEALEKRVEAPRKGMLIPVEKNENGFQEAIMEAVWQMHQKHAWADPQTGKPVSVGLVRVANIRTAIAIAKMLRESPLQARVTCYHSRLFNGQRMMLERDLDQILTRNKDPHAPVKHPSVRQHLISADFGLFIVVATPVEEVGRDHDFDWAIIEPSSTQSIVQCAGRVRRHRHDSVAYPNVGILQFNRRACVGKTVAFIYPGNETAENAEKFLGHDLSNLLNWKVLQADESVLDARLRFGTKIHKMANADEESLLDSLSNPMDRIISGGSLWMSVYTYQNWSLRSNSKNDEWRYDPENGEWYVYQETKEGWKWMAQDENRIKDNSKIHPQSWLCSTREQIEIFSEENYLSKEWAFTVQVPNRDSDRKIYRLQCTQDGVDFLD